MNVSLVSKATSDLDRIRESFGRQNPYAARAAKAIRSSLTKLGDNPYMGTQINGYSECYRKLTIPFGSSGYTVRYTIDSNQILINRIHHQREESDIEYVYR